MSSLFGQSVMFSNIERHHSMTQRSLVMMIMSDDFTFGAMTRCKSDSFDKYKEVQVVFASTFFKRNRVYLISILQSHSGFELTTKNTIILIVTK